MNFLQLVAFYCCFQRIQTLSIIAKIILKVYQNVFCFELGLKTTLAKISLCLLLNLKPMINCNDFARFYGLTYLCFQTACVADLHTFFLFLLQYLFSFDPFSFNNILQFISFFLLISWLQSINEPLKFNLFLIYANFITLTASDYLIIFIITAACFLQKFKQILLEF